MRTRSKTKKSGKQARAANSAKNSARTPKGRTVKEVIDRGWQLQVELGRLEDDLRIRRLERQAPLPIPAPPAPPARIKPAVRNRRRRTPDPRKVFIAMMKARGLDGPQICRALDAAERKDLEPLVSWVDHTGLRLWAALWTCEDRLIRNCVHTFVNSVAPFEAKRH
jgi:hypothetical protein